ncbi:MAG: hypothetical protein K2M31_02695 [Muribaculaceae bacterium]|nr:hypothetical protein [Muribaculaceae bacterium]
MKTLRNYIILILIICAAGAGIYLWLRSRLPEPQEKITIEEGKIVDLRPIADLCAMQIYRETFVSDTINNRVIYGIQKQQARISFDIEDFPAQVKAAVLPGDSVAGDTLRLKLPKEKVEVFESTEPNSWRVIDTKSLRLFESSKMTQAEENMAKRHAIERTRKNLYKDGSVIRARHEAAVTLTRMASAMTGRPVIVVE